MKRAKMKTRMNCDLFVYVPLTKEKFQLHDIQQSTKILELKNKLELITGIPISLQRLFYLDKEDLKDDSDLRSHDIVVLATLNLHVWRTWEKLIFYSFIGDENQIMKLKEKSLLPRQMQLEHYKNQINVALYVAASKGRQGLIIHLINEGADVNWKTNLGRTSLHAAAAAGKSNCIELLLKNGALPEIVDSYGKSSSTTANEFGHRESEKILFLFQWQKRAEGMDLKKYDTELMMHQQFDSGYPVWMRGKFQQMYMCKTLPAGEFIGTSIDAPRMKSFPLMSERNCEYDGKQPLVTNDMQNFSHHDMMESQENSLLPRLTQGAFGGHRTSESVKPRLSRMKRERKTFDDWIKEKNTAMKIKNENKHVKPKRKPWDIQTKHGKQIDGKVLSFQEWKEEKLKEKGLLKQFDDDEKPKKRIDVYIDETQMPSFERQYLLKLRPSYPPYHDDF